MLTGQKEESMDIRGSGAVVTGASMGLGAAVARALAEAGGRVVLVARRAGPLNEVVRSIRERGGDAHALVADVAAKADAHRIAGTAAALVGTVDLLVNNASTLGTVPLRPLLDTDCEALEEALAVNLVGPFRLAKVVAGAMALHGRGLIVNVSSDASVAAYAGWGVYGASKAALDHLGRIWGAELEGKGVRIVSVDPGEMDTRMHADAVPAADPATLLRPLVVAQRILALVREVESLPNGARVEAARWAEAAA
jgi:NAD(P)-dependent dehydrogenase (short-subunit alcohol dehydrogenase family)